MKKFRFTLTGMYVSIVSVLLIASVVFGIYQYKDKTEYKNLLNSMYQSKLLSVAAYLDDVTVLMNKLDAVTPDERIPMYAEIWKQAGSAHENLSDLPYNQSIVISSLKYLAQLSDFSYAMLKASVDSKLPSPEDSSTLKILKDYAEKYSSDMNRIAGQVNISPQVEWEMVTAEEVISTNADESIPSIAILGSIQTVSKTLQNYPALIYDGPFSDHLSKAVPSMTEGKELISAEQAEAICLSFVGKSLVESIALVSETEGDGHILPVFSFVVTTKNSAEPGLYLDITKRGGNVLWMLNTENTEMAAENISVQKALEQAERFLVQHGYFNMKYRYYDLTDSSIVFNFACYENGVIKYPDLIKLKLSLASGEVIAFDARGYVGSHKERALPDVIMSPEEAVSYLEEGLIILGSEKAVIPLSGGTEAFCYEFHAEKNDHRYLIYINAVTGKMENIFELIVNEFGVMAE